MTSKEIVGCSFENFVQHLPDLPDLHIPLVLQCVNYTWCYLAFGSGILQHLLGLLYLRMQMNILYVLYHMQYCIQVPIRVLQYINQYSPS